MTESTPKPILDRGWHELPCGASIEVKSNRGVKVLVKYILDSSGNLPVSDELLLTQASELLGYAVDLDGPWVTDLTGVYRGANLKERVR